MIREHWRVVMWVTILQILINYSLFYMVWIMVPGATGCSDSGITTSCDSSGCSYNDIKRISLQAKR